MKKYKVLTDCFWGPANHAYWEQGQGVEFPDDVKPPEHFQLVDRFGDPVEEKKIEQPEPRTFSEINKARDNSAPKSGMSAKSKVPQQSEAI